LRRGKGGPISTSLSRKGGSILSLRRRENGNFLLLKKGALACEKGSFPTFFFINSGESLGGMEEAFANKERGKEKLSYLRPEKLFPSPGSRTARKGEYEEGPFLGKREKKK